MQDNDYDQFTTALENNNNNNNNAGHQLKVSGNTLRKSVGSDVEDEEAKSGSSGKQ